MSSTADALAADPARRSAKRTRRTGAAVGACVATVPAFALAALIPDASGASPDAGLVPIVRFMGATKLALALLVAGLSIARYARPGRGRRLIAGLLASVCMAFGAGLIWSGTGFGGGFAAFATGLAVAALLTIKELEASLKRRP